MKGKEDFGEICTRNLADKMLQRVSTGVVKTLPLCCIMRVQDPLFENPCFIVCNVSEGQYFCKILCYIKMHRLHSTYIEIKENWPGHPDAGNAWLWQVSIFLFSMSVCLWLQNNNKKKGSWWLIATEILKWSLSVTQIWRWCWEGHYSWHVSFVVRWHI